MTEPKGNKFSNDPNLQRIQKAIEATQSQVGETGSFQDFLSTLNQNIMGTSDPSLSHDEVGAMFGDHCLIPTYKMGAIGNDWVITQSENRVIRGYFSGHMGSADNYVLHHGSTLYMSLTPLELQSHTIPLNEAVGNVVVAGLGLGMIVLNLLAQNRCDHIVVLEHSKDLIENFPAMLDEFATRLWFDALDDGRLSVVHADCKGVLPLEEIAKNIGYDHLEKHTVDYLYADIWPTIGSAEAITDTQNMCTQLQPKAAYYWGQELDLSTLTESMENIPPTNEALRQRAKDLKLPLSLLGYSDEFLKDYARATIAAHYNTLMA
jgi:hypothetical protein